MESKFATIISSGRKIPHPVDRRAPGSFHYCTPQIITTFRSSKRNSCSSVPLVRLLKLDPAPCKVISNSKRAMSAPLNRYVYDHEEKAFSNKEGYTWTPMFFRHCQPSISEQLHSNRISTRNNSHAEKKWNRQVLAGSSTYITCTGPPCWVRKNQGAIRDTGRPSMVGRVVSGGYSKFMESPYSAKRCCKYGKLATELATA